LRFIPCHSRAGARPTWRLAGEFARMAQSWKGAERLYRHCKAQCRDDSRRHEKLTAQALAIFEFDETQKTKLRSPFAGNPYVFRDCLPHAQQSRQHSGHETDGVHGVEPEA
jgi:hypothetical protein